MRTWEYRTIKWKWHVDDHREELSTDGEAELAEAGAQGWELVSLVREREFRGHVTTRAYMKRPIDQ